MIEFITIFLALLCPYFFLKYGQALQTIKNQQHMLAAKDSIIAVNRITIDSKEEVIKMLSNAVDQHLVDLDKYNGPSDEQVRQWVNKILEEGK